MMEIRLMTDKDTAQVAELEKLYFSSPWSLNAIESELSNPLSLWLIAVEGDEVMGYVGSQTVMDEADMMNIAVKSVFRRAGVAERLVNELIASLKSNGVHSLALEVRASNDPAIALYEKLGFVLTTIIGVRVKGGKLKNWEEKTFFNKNVVGIYICIQFRVI